MLPSASFEPNAARAVHIDRLVRARLAESLRPIVAGIVSQGAAERAETQRLLGAIEAGPIRPAVFGVYSDLIDAIYADDTARAEQVFRTLMQLEPAAPADGLRMVTLDEATLGTDQPERYIRLASDETAAPMPLEPVDADALRSASVLARSTLSLLEDAAPALAAELRNLIREIVFVKSEDDEGQQVFHGASTFYLWGAMFLNAVRHANRIELARGMAHESAHSLLFGFTFGAPLVENPPDERYASPVRTDPRPMDGVVHATFVLARMEYCIQKLLRSGRLTDEERSSALKASLQQQQKYRGGAEVVARHARFTPIGAAVMKAADDYMQELMHSPAYAH
jgi:HEXXH motif-containing protein